MVNELFAIYASISSSKEFNDGATVRIHNLFHNNKDVIVFGNKSNGNKGASPASIANLSNFYVGSIPKNETTTIKLKFNTRDEAQNYIKSILNYQNVVSNSLTRGVKGKR